MLHNAFLFLFFYIFAFIHVKIGDLNMHRKINNVAYIYRVGYFLNIQFQFNCDGIEL